MENELTLDLSQYDILTASEKLLQAVREKAKSWGMNANIECFIKREQQPQSHGSGYILRVVWESGPFDWGVGLSMGGITFDKHGDWDGKNPEIIVGKPVDWYLEPYHRFDVGFVPNSVLAEFDSKNEQGLSVVDEVTKYVAIKFMKKLEQYPELLQNIDRRIFEELIAELFYGFGYDIELTSRTRDGGKDIIAIKTIDSINLRYLIECKRPDPGNKISVSTVRELLGVSADDPASKALLVTTSAFTKDAKYLLNRHKWSLEGKEYQDVVDWIKNYNILKLQ